MYESKIKGSSPHENVTLKGNMKSSRELDHKFYGHMGAESGMRHESFKDPAKNAVRIGGFTERDYGNTKAVYHDKGTAKVFKKME